MTDDDIIRDALLQPDIEERSRILDAASAGDPARRRMLQTKLEDATPGDYQQTGAAPSGPLKPASYPSYEPAPAEPVEAGARFGPYKLLQKLGEGGMGAVWMARQDKPVHRMVALKVIRGGMESERVLARFEAERQALALMDHPNIAKVFDAGCGDAGQPYFVMELVKGIPVTKYCDNHKLDIKARLELFIPICQAIQHAHQKGIIHRDIKPSNVLVAQYDGRPVPKVIDFGVAKAIGQKLTDKTMFTDFGAVIGTLEYMSPEQAEMNALDIDTRSDVYSLGVLLYELLTGSTPLGRDTLQKAAFAEVLRRIKEEEPPRPSTRLSDSKDSLPSISAMRTIEPGKLPAQIRGDLDWIVMKALAKERERRYGTCNNFAMDLMHFLSNEPVEARPPSARYKLGKFVRRHRAGVTAAAACLLMLVGATVVSAWMAVRATRAEVVAVRERDKALEAEKTEHAVRQFFEDKVLRAPRQKSNQGLGPNTTVIEAVNNAAATVAESFADRPRVAASIRKVLGTTYFYIDKRNEAIEQLKLAVELWAPKVGEELDEEYLEALHNLAASYSQNAQYDKAIPIYLRVLDGKRAIEVKPLDEPDRNGRSATAVRRESTLHTLAALAVSYSAAGQQEKAIGEFRKVLADPLATAQPLSKLTLDAKANLGAAYMELGQWDKALELTTEIDAYRRANLPAHDTSRHTTTYNLGTLYLELGQYERAIPLLREVVSLLTEHQGKEHADTINAKIVLGRAYRGNKQLAEAKAILNEALKQQEVKYQGNDPTLSTLDEVGRVLIELGDFANAERRLLMGLASREKANPKSVRAAFTRSLIGAAMAGQKKPEAENLMTKAYNEMIEEKDKIPFAERPKRLAEAANRLADFYESQGKKTEADLWRRNAKDASLMPSP